MTNFQSIFGLFIVLLITLTMGLQFTNFREGFQNTESNIKNDDMPIYTKTNNSMAKQGVLDDMSSNY